MRIGILTFHSAHNYGAVLQCYALQTYLECLGHKVEVIDYRLPSMLKVYQVFDFRRFLSLNPLLCFRKITKELRLLPLRRHRYASFESFINSNLHLAPTANITDLPYNIIFIGSDQVWNTQLTSGYDKYYWGKFTHPAATILATYAASMEGNPSDEKCREMIPLLHNFSFLSVREEMLARRLQEHSHVEVQSTVDTTLLLNPSAWRSLAGERIIKNDYVLLYEVQPNSRAEQAAAIAAKELGTTVVTLASLLEANKDDFSAIASPITFLNLCRYATFIVAASFHGTVFSLLFSRPFVSIKSNTKKDGRINNLLNPMGLEERFVSYLDETSFSKLRSMDKITTLEGLEAIEKSKQYINKVLAHVQES